MLTEYITCGTINGHDNVSKRKLIAQETADFFVPLAQKLGLKKAAQEFEKMCYEVFEAEGLVAARLK